MTDRRLLPHAEFGDDPSGYCGCADCCTDGERTWIDRARPEWPREVAHDHLDADTHHAPTTEAGVLPGEHDNCATCGLATTSDGTRHGFDAS